MEKSVVLHLHMETVSAHITYRQEEKENTGQHLAELVPTTS